MCPGVHLNTHTSIYKVSRGWLLEADEKRIAHTYSGSRPRGAQPKGA